MESIGIIRDVITFNPSNRKRIYHEFEGIYKGYYIRARTDNSHKLGYASYGIKGGAVEYLEVWEERVLIGKDSLKSTKEKRLTDTHDLRFKYYNKWERRSRTKKHAHILSEIVKQLEVIADRKRTFF
nr:hypothetical protein [uncultured Fluviicola sp.]